MIDDDDDILDLAEDDEEDPRQMLRGVWRILIVDDDEDVHASTKMAVHDSIVQGRPLEFLHAYSAKEGREVLMREKDIAVILLDVVMEEADSGLKLVAVIRGELGMSEVRIILRTGQPGYAPEADAVRDFDINDYKTKSDLTRNKLFASLTAAVRSYQQINALNASRRGLAMILEASSRLMAIQGLNDFAAGVITQLAALLQVAPEGLVCAQQFAAPDEPAQFRIVAAAGHYQEMIAKPLSTIEDDKVRALLESCFTARHSMFSPEATVLFFGSSTGQDMAVFLDLSDPVSDDNQNLLSVFCNNIAACFDNVRLFQQLNASAFQDALCKLPNRVALVGAIETMRSEGRVQNQVLAVVDIDRFSEVNHAFGHPYGDRLLRAFSVRLLDRFGGQAIVARLGSDVFALLGKETVLTPEAIHEGLREPLTLDGRLVQTQATVGMLRLAEAEGEASSILTDAAIAVQVAKVHHRGGHLYFSNDMSSEIRERVRLLEALRIAVDTERLTVVYQPQFDIHTRKVVGLEALLRWRTDDGDYVAPDRFIPLAEHSGLIISLGTWVLRSACMEAVHLAAIGHPLRMAVNLSVAQVREPQFLPTLDAALADTKIDPKTLELEITESMAMNDMNFMKAQIEQIKRRGAAVAIDDFGTGFSSLAYLEQLKVDRLKIDKAFVHRLDAQGYAKSIAASVTQMAGHLDLEVIAEGVETDEQLQCLQKIGVNEGQGWLIAKAMPAADLPAWLDAAAR